MFRISRLRLAPMVLMGFLSIGSLASLSGCGGDGGSNISATSRHYTSTVALTAPQTGVLDLIVTANNTVTGTLTVNDNSSRAARTRAVVVTVQLTGTVAANGDLTLTGTFTPTEGSPQTTRVTGNLGSVAGTSGGSLILNYLNQNFNGTWTFQAAVTPGNNGTGVGGGVTATFSAVSGTNAITTNLSLPLVAGTNSTLPFIGKTLSISATPANGDYSRNILLGAQGGAVVGTYTIDNDKYSVVYGEGLGVNAKQWAASGGTLKITAVSSTSVSFEVMGATMSPQAGLATVAPTGTFTLNFSGTTSALISN